MHVKENAKQVLKIKYIDFSSIGIGKEYNIYIGYYFADIIGSGFVSKAQIAKAYPDTKETDFIPNEIVSPYSFKSFEAAEKWAKEYAQKNNIEYIGGDR